MGLIWTATLPAHRQYMLTLRFNAIFPDRPGLAGTKMSPLWILMELI